MESKSVKLVNKKVNKTDKLTLEELLSLRDATSIVCEEYESSLVANRNEPSFRERYESDLFEYNKYKDINKRLFFLIKEKIDKVIGVK